MCTSGGVAAWGHASVRSTIYAVHDELTTALLLAADGDRCAFTGAITQLQPIVRRYCATLVGIDDADDAAQDTMMRVWGAVSRYRGEAPAIVYVLAIARRACADLVRTKQRHRRLGQRLLNNAFVSPTACDDTGAHHALSAGLERLSPDQREAFVLTQVVGCTYEETSTITGVAVGTVRSRVARARDALMSYCAVAESA